MRRAALAAAVLLAGCLLPSPPEPPRYFTPIGSGDDARQPAAALATAVRLAPVRSPVYLRELMAWRRSNVEYGFYDQRRWAELPAVYVERALARELFVQESIPEATAADAPVLTTDLRAFEEVLTPAHEAVVGLRVALVRGGCVLLRRDVDARRPLGGDDPALVARAMGEALDEVARTTGEAVRQALARGGRCAR